MLYSKDLAKHFGVDGVRYYVLSEMPYAQDGSITYQNLIAKYNSDLANTLGNLVNRTVAMCRKYFDGEILVPDTPDALDEDLKQTALATVPKFCALMDEFRTADALDAIMGLARAPTNTSMKPCPGRLPKRKRRKAALGRCFTIYWNPFASSQ